MGSGNLRGMWTRNLQRMQSNWTCGRVHRGALHLRSRMLWGKKMRVLGSRVELDILWIQDVVSHVPDVLDLIWPRMVMLSEEVTEVTFDLVMKARFNSL